MPIVTPAPAAGPRALGRWLSQDFAATIGRCLAHMRSLTMVHQEQIPAPNQRPPRHARRYRAGGRSSRAVRRANGRRPGVRPGQHGGGGRDRVRARPADTTCPSNSTGCCRPAASTATNRPGTTATAIRTFRPRCWGLRWPCRSAAASSCWAPGNRSSTSNATSAAASGPSSSP